ncbi:ATP-binding protein [Roseovarius indicus]|uniref:ATP-binding protein n=1 Tax=Roseovarius indicus TaxID=540747 RepID=UPI0032EB5E52
MDGNQSFSPRVLRTGATLAYLLVILAVHWLWIGNGFVLEYKILWLANGVAALLFGSRILNPHFTPLGVAASNAFVAASALVLALASQSLTVADQDLIHATIAVIGLLFIACVLILIVREDASLEQRNWVLAIEAVARWAGAPLVIFTVLILEFAWLFHRESPAELLLILAVWTTIVALNPVEFIWSWYKRFFSKENEVPSSAVGQIVARQNPGLVLIRQLDDRRLKLGTLMALSDEHGPTTLGVALNYVGRDEGVLLRALSLPVPKGIAGKVNRVAVGHAIASEFSIDPSAQGEIGVLSRIENFCGIVDSESNLDAIQIEVVADEHVEEGKLVDVMIGDQKVIYQIVDGVTREEAVQQKNKYGFARAKARKIGKWIEEKKNFAPVPWLPQINAPVFLLDSVDFVAHPDAIGHFPGTDYSVSINPAELVTHNTAVLGILGIGKSYLAIELAERMFAEGIKVICLDLTDQYAHLLEDFIDKGFQKSASEELHAAAKGRPVDAGKDEGGSVGAFQQAVLGKLSEFLSEKCQAKIWIINPANFRVSRQTTNAFKDSAAFRDLSPSEITAIISDAALKVCQEKGMTDQARACLIYEEAHTLVPEWNSVSNEGDKNATAASARAILQGRKFGLGCLLITQRTANVTKTILNQCNTIFAMRTFDDTGKEFLGNYIGRDYAGVLPSLAERHAVLFGKASSCDNPVLLRLNDRDNFIGVFRKPEEDLAEENGSQHE